MRIGEILQRLRRVYPSTGEFTVFPTQSIFPSSMTHSHLVNRFFNQF